MKRNVKKRVHKVKYVHEKEICENTIATVTFEQTSMKQLTNPQSTMEISDITKFLIRCISVICV